MATKQESPSEPLRPVAIFTQRNGQPYVLFGRNVGGDSPYGVSGQTFGEFAAEHGSAPVQTFVIEDGPHIAVWEALFDDMERAGVVMLIDPGWPA